MRKGNLLLVIAAALLLAGPVFAELQNVEVGGSLFIRGNWIRNTFTTFGPNGQPSPAVRWPASSMRGRAVGPFGPNVISVFDWDDDGDDVAFVEQRTRLNVKADFTQNVGAFMEIDSYDIWGEDFRSQNYLTGADTRSRSVDDVEFFQAYVQADQMFGVPIRLRLGRQELSFGSQWLVGPRDFAFFKTGLSFDAIRATYTHDMFTVDVFASKLLDTLRSLGKGDIDFYGVYGSWTSIPDVTIDAYYFLLRDDTPRTEDTNGGPLLEYIEHLARLDEYDSTLLNTVGARFAAKKWGFDVDAEGAYQFGPADSAGKTFKAFRYGDDRANFNTFGLKLDAGYTIDINDKYKPHVFAGFRYYNGEDNRHVNLLDSMNPLRRPHSSLSFNRLFSNEINSGFMDLNNDLSNAWLLRGGIEGPIIGRLGGRAAVTYFQAVDPFFAPNVYKVFGAKIPSIFSWDTKPNDSDMGWETDLFFEYHYSQDLVFEAGWAHLFPGNGLRQGSYSRFMGMIFTGGTAKKDGDYIYLGSKLSF